jgi:hypothetical protein
MRKAGFQITIRDLVIAMAIVGLLLGHLTHLFRTRPRRNRVTIRVFNKSSENIRFLRYQWDTVTRLVESRGENSGTVGIAPRGLKSFRVDLPASVDFTLSCTTQGGRMTSGPVRVDVEGGHPDSLDFYVRPYGIVVRGTTGTGKQAHGQQDEKGGT